LRGKELINSGAIGQVDFDKLKTNAIESLHVLEQTESALADAKLNLTYTTIRAPIDGRTGKSMVGVGEIITSNIAMVNIVELNPIRVDFQVSEATLNQIRSLNSQTGDSYKDISKLPVKIKLSDGAYFPELGFIDFYDNKVNPTTGTWNVRASFPNPRRDILPGQFVKVEVADAVKKQAILIPQQAVQEDQEGRFVMLINEHNIIEKRLLLLGQRYGINWEVNKGLKEGETIVVDGLQRIRTGIEVNVNYSHEPPFSNGSAKSKNNNQG
jgi:membrane fusion protein (multidrug efflux system)